MKSARLQPMPLPPLLRPLRLALPDLPDESDSPPVSSDDESEYYYASNEDDNSTDDEDEGYAADLEYDKSILDSYSQQGVDSPAVPDSLPVKEEIKSSEVESEDRVSNEDDHSKVSYPIFSRGHHDSLDYNADLEYDRPIWEKYFQQADESMGFHIKDCPGHRLPTFYRLPRYMNVRKKFRMMNDYAAMAIKKYNDDNGTDYVVLGVLEVKGCGRRDYNFYLIFEVNLGDGDRRRKFMQALVVKDKDNNLDFPVVMPKPDYYPGYICGL